MRPQGLDVDDASRVAPTVDNQVVGSDPNGPEFTIAWVPKVLGAARQGPVGPRQHRAGLPALRHARGLLGARQGPAPAVDQSIATPADFKGKKIGVWDFGNEYEVIAAGRKVGLEAGTDYERVIQPFDMSLLLNREIDAAEAMIYNEYAQVLETTNPETGRAVPARGPERHRLQRGRDRHAPGRHLGARRVARRGGQRGHRDTFLAASFEGWMYCRDNPDECVQYDARRRARRSGAGHQAWMMNEINTLVWPSATGIGDMPVDTWNQTIQIAKDAKLLTVDPDPSAYRTDLAAAARAQIQGDATGANFTPVTVTVTAGGK